MNEIIGSHIYLAPEIFKQSYDISVDNWSLGVMMYFMLFGNPPFLAQTKNLLEKQIINSEPDYGNSDS
jgi:serine/threonine protein kinase